MAKKAAAPRTPAERMLICARYMMQKKSVKWSELYNAMFGVGGWMGRLFPTEIERGKFLKSKEYKEIEALLEKTVDDMDVKSSSADRLATASGKIALRIPRSLHAGLAAEAEVEGVSLNQLILSKLAISLSAKV